MTMEDKKNAVKLDEEKLEQVSGGSAGYMRHYGMCMGYGDYHTLMLQIEARGKEMTIHERDEFLRKCMRHYCSGEYDCSSCPVKAFRESL